MAIYAVSDLHGQYELFQKGIKTIGFTEEDFLYILGDVIDRGPDGIRLLRYIQKQQNMDMLLGNHEVMMLNSVDQQGGPLCTGRETSIWLDYNGGWETLKDYLDLSLLSRKRLLGWLRNRFVLKTVEVGDKVFCLSHSYFSESVLNKRFRYSDLRKVCEVVWESIYRKDSRAHQTDPYSRHSCTFVTGHVPVQYARVEMGQKRCPSGLGALWNKNMADIDGGCSYGEDFYDGTPESENGMIFLRLDDLKEFPVRFV